MKRIVRAFSRLKISLELAVTCLQGACCFFPICSSCSGDSGWGTWWGPACAPWAASSNCPFPAAVQCHHRHDAGCRSEGQEMPGTGKIYCCVPSVLVLREVVWSVPGSSSALISLTKCSNQCNKGCLKEQENNLSKCFSFNIFLVTKTNLLRMK